ncbi:zinc finger BED domain-containing protein RICESLEEPER 1-like [Vicia villosa]|uniref:zinc finger BED domain-containing protein RICESLEEPER 1-like n=1 Tax=Vicia villosa TaxID=3911 RepID=UPI00273BF4B0|nr:zinc finger BED domain-containing protein RICESLEEPER 1-like [Vicia villosa]
MVQCYCCNRFGHFAKDCWSNKEEAKIARGDSDDEPVLLMAYESDEEPVNSEEESEYEVSEDESELEDDSEAEDKSESEGDSESEGESEDESESEEDSASDDESELESSEEELESEDEESSGDSKDESDGGTSEGGASEGSPASGGGHDSERKDYEVGTSEGRASEGDPTSKGGGFEQNPGVNKGGTSGGNQTSEENPEGDMVPESEGDYELLGDNERRKFAVTLLTDNTTQNTTTTQNTSTTQNTTTADDGATPPVDLDQSAQSRRNAFGKAPRPKKYVVHIEMVLIEMSDGTKKWKCRWCGKLYTYDVKWKSTFNGKKHLENCIQRKLRLKGNTDKHVAQSRLNVVCDITPCLATSTYNRARVREVATHMILGYEFPFSVMEGVIFNEFLREIYPWYKKITRQQIKFDSETFYEAERVKMKKSMYLINKISLTTELWWCGEQMICYMTVTSYFFDSKWQFNKRVLSFKNVPPPHSCEVLCRELIKVLDDGGIRDKVVSISIDNASANDNCIVRLKRDYSGRRNLPLNGKMFHVRCCAHILNLLVQDGLDMIKVTIDKIRNGVKYLLNSETKCKAFKKLVDELQLEGRMQVLGTKTRWNSTWLMLSTTYHYREVWPRYAEENGAFLKYSPDANDWEDVHDICKFLEVFADVTSIISGTSYPTANLFLDELYMVKVLLDKSSSISNNPQLQALANEMKLKCDKYWSEFNTLICIGAVLDPRYKMIFIKWVYPLYLNPTQATAYEQELATNLKSIFQMYQDTYGTNDENVLVSETLEVGSSSGLGRRSFEMFLETIVGNTNSKYDLEIYLEKSPLKDPPKTKFDVLTWWMGNEAKYPVLSKLAKDILTVPVATVASEATFNVGKRAIDPKRSYMKTKTIEMVLCGGDWVKEKYVIKKGCTASILEEPEDLTYHFGEDPIVASSTTKT